MRQLVTTVIASLKPAQHFISLRYSEALIECNDNINNNENNNNKETTILSNDERTYSVGTMSDSIISETLLLSRSILFVQDIVTLIV